MRNLRTTINYGIDLGTTNSAIGQQAGTRTVILDGPGGILVPSVVHIAASGQVQVGRAALEQRNTDPANVVGEFKRLMGTAETIFFPSVGRRFTPVELSAEVLKALLARAEPGNGGPVDAAVVTIPAMFQLPQCEATQQAATLAGLRFAPLLQEPIAAAIASIGSTDLHDGYWLVYDFGGGTFDVSLVRSRGGRLQVLDHDGDNHLGGKDFDRLLTRRAADAVRKEGRLPNFSRAAGPLEGAFERLRVEAERVRIRLSEAEAERFRVEKLAQAPDGSWVDIEFGITREELEALIRPSILRTIQLCRKILDRNQLSPSELKRLVLVGGPTLTPCMQKILEAELGVDSRHYVDPICAVAIGAAIYASTQRVPAALRASSESSGELTLDLSYESMTTDAQPMVAGQVKGIAGAGTWRARIASPDGRFDSGWLALRGEGAFSTRVSLAPNCLNLFDLMVERDGAEVPELTGQFSIIHGTTIARPVLSQSIGVALADNSVRWYLRKGVILPARQRVSHATTVGLRRGQTGTAVLVPLVQGESDFADRNTPVGVIQIEAAGLEQDLPVGSEVIVTLSVDEHSITRAEAYVPLLGVTFDRIVKFGLETRTSDAIRKGVDEQRARLAELEKMASDLEASTGEGVDTRVKAIEDLLEDGGADDRNQADQLLKSLTGMIDSWKVRDQEQQLREKFANSDEQILQLLDANDTERRRRYATLSNEFKTAIARADLSLAETRYKAIESLEWSLLREQPSFWVGLYNYLVAQLSSGPRAAEARMPIEQGKAALARNDLDGLRTACIALVKLLPDRGEQQLPSVLTSHLA